MALVTEKMLKTELQAQRPATRRVRMADGLVKPQAPCACHRNHGAEIPSGGDIVRDHVPQAHETLVVEQRLAHLGRPAPVSSIT